MIVGVALFNINTKELVSLLKPNRHYNIIRVLFQENIKPTGSNGWIQGFIDQEGKFLNREEAAIYAFQCSQIKEQTDILFSEDLW